VFYRPRPQPPAPNIEVMRFDGSFTCAEEIIEWTGKRAVIQLNLLCVLARDGGKRRVFTGDYVIKTVNGDLGTMTMEQLNSRYELIFDNENEVPGARIGGIGRHAPRNVDA